ncbi:MAG: sugar phosphate isomerase/epimerase [Desulfobacteraceae bacterium]|nr:MAG: sugar phosphate isomerase/epimerase [Desulfobacteraceae bacterium]
MQKIGCKIDEVRVDGGVKAFRDDLKYFSQIGIEAVELPVHGLDVIKNGLIDKVSLQNILSILRDFNFEYSVHSPNPLNLMDQQDPELHYSVFRAGLEFAAAVGAGILVYHAGRFIPEEIFPIPGHHDVSKVQAQKLLEQERNYLVRLADEFPQIMICIENARPYLHYSPYCYGEQIEMLKNQVVLSDRNNVKIALDIGHLNMAAQFYHFNLIEAVQTIRDFIFHVHVHDNFGRAVYPNEKTQTHLIPFGRGDAHMPIHWGSIPIRDILGAFMDAYSGMFIMELRSRYFPFTEECKNNLERIIEELRCFEHLPLSVWEKAQDLPSQTLHARM